MLVESRDRILFNKPMIDIEVPLSLDRDFKMTLRDLEVDKNLVVIIKAKLCCF